MESWAEFMKLRSRLNEVIKVKGYQKKWLAEQVGVSQTQFAHWCSNDKETGYIKAVPSVLNAMTLARILNSNVEELFELVEGD